MQYGGHYEVDALINASVRGKYALSPMSQIVLSASFSPPYQWEMPHRSEKDRHSTTQPVGMDCGLLGELPVYHNSVPVLVIPVVHLYPLLVIANLLCHLHPVLGLYLVHSPHGLEAGPLEALAAHAPGEMKGVKSSDVRIGLAIVLQVFHQKCPTAVPAPQRNKAHQGVQERRLAQVHQALVISSQYPD